MCEWNEHWGHMVDVRLFHPRKDGIQTVSVDKCIAPIVQALNNAGLQTIASCCGHGHRPGSIVLEDGREIIIARNYDEACAIHNISPLNIHGEPVKKVDG